MHSLETVARHALERAGDRTALRDTRIVSGGMISQTARIRSEQGDYLLKWGDHGLHQLFTIEARSLERLAATGTLRIPKVLAFHDADQGEAPFNYLLLEWIEPPLSRNENTLYEQLGQRLAEMHRASAPAYGLDFDTYLGVMPQRNAWQTRWSTFFGQQRLGVQAEIARSKGHLRGQRAQRLARLIERIDDWLGDHQPPPALLHGDLWHGNLLVDAQGAPVLIDPAIFYGDRECEIAYTGLFGGFPSRFYEAYQATWPLPKGWQERRDLYNLYHLVNHLNHFGERYGAYVDQVLQRYC
jgi:protein-ribulosamine 3-kinase